MTRSHLRLAAVLNGLLLAFSLASLALTFHLFTEVRRGLTHVPWRDQWMFIYELRNLQQHGQPLWSMLWAPYWGHRLVLPRLLFLADAKLFALRNTPLVLLIFALQFSQIAMFASAAWPLRRTAYFAAVLAAWHLLLSPFQMENLIWGLEIEFGLVYTSSILSFFLLSRYARDRRPVFLIGACLGALISTLSMANGLITWPCLIAQALYLRLDRRIAGLLAVLGGVTAALFLYHYTPAATGDWRHPFDSARAIATLLGGPFTLTSRILGEAAGWIGLLAAATILVVRDRAADRLVTAFPIAVIGFVLLTSASIVAGRLGIAEFTARASQGLEILPSRYFVIALLFWSSLFLLSLLTFNGRRTIVSIVGLVVLALSAGSLPIEFRSATAWADAFHEMDASASAMLIGVDDPARLRNIWPIDSQRSEWTAYLRAQRLSIFTEPRANWFGKQIRYAIGAEAAPQAACEGAIETREELPGQPGAWRLTGWIWNKADGTVPRDILLTDSQALVIGLGRAGLLHHDVGGRAYANPTFWRAGWLGYVNAPQFGARPTVYGLFAHRQGACQIASESTPSLF